MQKPDEKQSLPDKAYRLGFNYEKQHGVCSQSALRAIMDALEGSTDPLLFRALFGFVGGAGDSTRAMCGGLSAGIAAISQRFGRQLGDLGNESQPDFTCNELVRQLMGRYEEEFGSFICADIQTRLMGQVFDFSDPSAWDTFLAAGGHEVKCPHVVGSAARWTVEILQNKERKKA